MAYKQVRQFDQSKATTKRGWCLVNVRSGFDINPKYQSAWQAWLHTQQHTGTIPKGVDVPLFFWYKNAENGHIGVRLANGQFWSDGRIYPNLLAYRVTHPAVIYRGWGESVDDVAVLKYVPDPKPVSLVGRTAHLSRNVSSWAVYPLNKPPVRANAIAHLNPKKFGGLSYKLLAATKWPNTYTIQTEDFGRVNIYLDKDATIK